MALGADREVELLNEPGVGLAALLEKYLGVRLDKRYQRADWSTRPLTREMLEYAAADTLHLPALRDILQSQLQERGRLEWAEEEFSIDLNNMRDAEGRFRRSRIAAEACLRPFQLWPELLHLRQRSRLASERLGEFLADCRF